MVSILTGGNPILSAQRWQFSILRKMLRVSPVQTLLTIALSIVGRLSLLLSFLLPFKAILLAGKQDVPNFVLQFLPEIGRSQFVFSLCALAVIFYLISIVTDWAIKPVLESGSERIAHRAGKVSSQYSVKDQTRSFYEKICKGQSALVLVGLLCLALLFLYPKLALVTCLVLLAPWILVSLAVQSRPGIKNWFYKYRNDLMRRLQFVGLMICFMSIVLDLLDESAPSFLIAIVGFIVSRQILNYQLEYARVVSALTTEKEKVNNLFFYGDVVWQKALPQFNQWPDISLEKVRDICSIGLEQAGVDCGSNIRTRWRNCNVFSILTLDVVCGGDIGEEEDQHFVKIYSPRLIPNAMLEEALLGIESGVSLPAPRFHLRTNIMGHECIVMEGVGSAIGDIKSYSSRILELLTRLWSARLPTRLYSTLERSTQCSIDEIDEHIVSQLLVMAVDEQQYETVSAFKREFEHIADIVRRLPRVLHNPELSIDTVVIQADDELVSTHWGKCSIEPIGTALWNINKLDRASVQNVIEEVSAHHNSMAGLKPEHLLLAGAMHKLYRTRQRQRYDRAISAIAAMLELYGAIQSETE